MLPTESISIKTPQDIDGMRIAGQCAADVLVMLAPYVKPGVTTNQLDRLCHDYIVNEQKAIPAPLNYRGYPKSICTSINQVICHGIPDDKPLRNGDIVNVDVTVLKDGYFGDTSKMFCVGKVAPHARRLVSVTQACLYEAIKILREGVRLGDIGARIQQIAESSHYSVVREFCGHGIGKVFHEPPQVLHYGKAGTGAELKAGMVITIEPMINQGVWRSKMLANGWTAVTQDGALSAQWEHTLLITREGCEILTLREEEQGSISRRVVA